MSVNFKGMNVAVNMRKNKKILFWITTKKKNTWKRINKDTKKIYLNILLNLNLFYFFSSFFNT